LGATLNASVLPVTKEQARKIISRVSESELFRKSPRLREFFIYVADCTLEARLEDVREQVIAERLFNRKPSLGGQDSIVRAEARNLRKRLELYFATEGLAERTIVVMPRGGYGLTFLPRPANSSIEVLEQPAAIEIPSEQHRPLQRAAMILLAVIALVLTILVLILYFRYTALQSDLGPLRQQYPLSELFDVHQPALIVTSDIGVLQISSLLHRQISLDEYVSRNYPTLPETNPPDLSRNWSMYEYTDGREMTIAGLLLAQNPLFSRNTLLSSGHGVQLQDFKDHNVVLIGSPISNPWAELYEDKLNFRCNLAPDGRIRFSYPPGAKGFPQYLPSDDDVQHHRTYARIAFLPRTANSSAALLIAGATGQATQAAGELIVDRDRIARILQQMKLDPSGGAHFFELLIRMDNFVGGAILPEVVAWRLTPAPER
jgi:hypothetical protein